MTWRQARVLREALLEALAVVRGLGHPLKPRLIAVLAKLPRGVLTLALWAMSRAKATRDLAVFGPTEVQRLIDAMIAVAPERTRRLQDIRPPSV